jgi:hypothetical protein
MKHSVLSGLLYGVMVYSFMNFVVLPLSAYHVPIMLRPTIGLARDIAIVMIMVGLPISLIVRKYSTHPFVTSSNIRS